MGLIFVYVCSNTETSTNYFLSSATCLILPGMVAAIVVNMTQHLICHLLNSLLVLCCSYLILPPPSKLSLFLQNTKYLLPLSQISERKVCDAVRPDRDVDGFNVLNVGRFCVNEDAFMPATPSGVLEIIRRLSKKFCNKCSWIIIKI